jgi:hypothetical protein
MMMKNSKGRMEMKVEEMSEKQLVESNNSEHKSKVLLPYIWFQFEAKC